MRAATRLTTDTSGGLHLGHSAVKLEGQQRHIEGSTSEIEDQHLSGLVLVQAIQTVRQSGGGRLVDDAENIEASNAAGGLGGSALRVVEVRRHGDDSLGKSEEKRDRTSTVNREENSGSQKTVGDGSGLRLQEPTRARAQNPKCPAPIQRACNCDVHENSP